MSKEKTKNNLQSINNNSSNNINDCKNEENINNSNLSTQVLSIKKEKKPKKGKKPKGTDFLDYAKDKGITFIIHYEGESQKIKSPSHKSTPQTKKENPKITSPSKTLNNRINNNSVNSLDDAINNITNIQKISINTNDNNINSNKKQSKINNTTNPQKKFIKKLNDNLKNLKVTSQYKYIFNYLPNQTNFLSKQLYNKYNSMFFEYSDHLYNYQQTIHPNTDDQITSLHNFYEEIHQLFYNYQYQMIMKNIQNKQKEPQHFDSSVPEKPFFYHNHSELVEATNTLSLLEYLFDFDNLNVDPLLRNLLDEEGYVSVDILSLKHPQIKKFSLTKEKIEKVLADHRQNEITETVETFDSILIRNRYWNEKSEKILSIDIVYQKQIMLLPNIMMNIKINNINNYNNESFILNSSIFTTST